MTPCWRSTPLGDTGDAVFDRFPVLQTERLCLRESRLADAEVIYAVLSSDTVTRYYSLSPLASVEEARALVERRAAAFRRQERIRWAIARREDDAVLGSCGYVHWDRESRRAEVGYELHPDWQGRGLMYEALTAMLSFGFTQMDLNRVEALVVPENEPSLRLLRRLGFEEEGLLRDYSFWKGRFHDLRLFSLLKKDWNG